ncbi:MAG: winged helix-turn-helix domain-containing protein, partial [Gammaproteobacteria bacterium]|nr:winged helix-turn-helix domain-containing protein [Gammaproteobacteria bacterium]
DLKTGFSIDGRTVYPLLGKISDGMSEYHVEPKAMDVLLMLARAPGKVVLREQILEQVWQGRPVADDALSKCITELRKALCDNARQPRFIETVPKRGYRLLSKITSLETARRTPRYALAAAVIAAATAAAFILLSNLGEAPISQPAAGKHTIAVLPFKNRSDDPGDRYIVDGMQDDLITHLARFNDWQVISRTSVEPYRETTDSLREIGARLNASLIIEGGVQRSGGEVRINVQLVDVPSDAHVWAATYDRALTVETLFEVQSEIVASVARELSAALEADKYVSRDAPTSNFEAYNEYVKGRGRVNVESVTSLNAAAENFKAAIELDENYADAYAALADTYLSLGMYFFGGLSVSEAIELAEPLVVRAMELNPNLPSAYAAAGLMHMMQKDAAASATALDRAIALQPSYSRAYRLYASLRWQQQRQDDAIELAEHAISLDPGSGPINFDLGRYYDAVGRNDEAMDRYIAAAQLMPGNSLARVYLGAIKYLNFGEIAESLIWYREASALDPESPSMQAVTAMAYLEIGDLQRAETFVQKGMAIDPNSFWPRFTQMCLNQRKGEIAAAEEDAKILLDHYATSPDALRTLRDRDLANGDVQIALVRYAKAYPELSVSAVSAVNSSNLFAAVDFAQVLIENGETERANHLLAQALEVTATRQRGGTFGFWLADVLALALQGKKEEAITRLQEAIDSGYRIKLWYFLYMDPNLESIRDDPAFLQLRSHTEKLIQEQAEKYAVLSASLNLDEDT